VDCVVLEGRKLCDRKNGNCANAGCPGGGAEYLQIMREDHLGCEELYCLVPYVKLHLKSTQQM